MGHSGGAHPTGLVRREAKTIFLRAPYSDFSALAQGHKTEFRSKRVGAATINAPTPVVLYAVSGGGHKRQQLMVLAEYREARLREIEEEPDSLVREGFATYDEFRRYWRRRTGRPYRPLEEVGVYRLSPWLDTERLRLGMVLLDRLYADYLPANA